jgi:hypothetical protein
MAVSATLPKDCFGAADEAPATLAQHAPGNTPDAKPRGPAPDISPNAPLSEAFAATLGPPDLSVQIPRDQRSRRKGGTLTRVAIAVCLGASMIYGWRLYGGTAEDMFARWAPSLGSIAMQPAATQRRAPQAPYPTPAQAAAPLPAQAGSQVGPQVGMIARPVTAAAQETAAADRRQLDTMARDLATLHRTVEQLAAGREQLTRALVQLQDEKPDNPPAAKPHKRRLDRVSAPGHVSDAFDPTQNPNAPGVPRTLGSIVLRRTSPRRRAAAPRPRRRRR